MKRLLLLLFMLVGGAAAQNTRFDNIVLGPKGTVPFATVAVCTQPANTSTTPCTPAATLCTSLTDPTCNQTNIVTADSLGNYHFYIPPSQTPFTLQYYGPQIAAPLVLPDQQVPLTVTGSTKSLNNIQFADQYAGADRSAKIQAAINGCTGNSCVIYATNLPTESAGGSVNIDPGTSKVVTLYLPAGTTYVSQIILRPSFKAIGMGSGGFSQQSILQSCATCGTTDVFVLGGTAAISGVHLEGFRIYGANGSAGAANQGALSFIAAANGGGLFNSVIQDLNILGFAGSGGTHGVIRFDGSAGGSPPGINQFNTIRNVESFRTTGGGPVVEINGFSGQLDFTDCHFDAQPADTTGTNIVIQDSATNLFPLTINFYNVTTQAGNTGVSIKGCNLCTFLQMHFEKAKVAYLIAPSISGTTLTTVGISYNQFNGDVAQGGGGALVNVTEAAAKAAVVFGPLNNYSAVNADVTGNVGAVTQIANVGPTVNGTFLWHQNSGFSYLNINSGVTPDGTGFKHLRTTAGCATAASLAATCDTTVTWTSAFVDTNVTPMCVGVGITSGVPLNGGIVSRNGANAIFRTVSGTAAAAQYTNIYCTAVHD